MSAPQKAAVSAHEPDWSREHKAVFEWNPSRALIASIRSYQRWTGRNPVHVILRCWAVLRYRFWSIVTGADIPLCVQIDGGLMMPHPNGVVVHPRVRIGPNCVIFQQVTLGSNGRGCPTIGGHVDIGAGAKVLGPISIGNDVLIGANAVVVNDVPNNSTVAGIPARVIMQGSQE